MKSIRLFNSWEEAFEKIPPTSALSIELEGVSICLVNFNNNLFAIGNSCPHLGELLSKGTINYLGEIVCPWHSFRFNLKNGEEALRRCRDARIYSVSEGKDGGVYISV